MKRAARRVETGGWVVFPAIILLGLIFAGASVSVRAQDQSAQAPQQTQEQQTQDARSGAKPRGTGRELAHESREGAGEETDQNAQFKQSAAVQWVARHTGLSLLHAYWLCVLLNFAVIGGVIFWAARKNLPGMFRERTAAIQKAMQEAQKASEEARRRLAEIESRLMKLDVEIGMMRNAAESEAAAEETRIHAAAEEDARKIVESAAQEIAAAAKTARRELTAYAGDLAVGLAQKQIRVDAATDQALVRGFAGQLGAAPDGPQDIREKGGR